MPVVILGGGLAGLSAAAALEDAGSDYALFEAAPAVGGLTRSIQAGDFYFDYTGHLLHLARHDTPADIPYAGLTNGDWIRIDRKSRALIRGHLITAPVQYNLHELPAHHLESVLESYEGRTPLTNPAEASFDAYLKSAFGNCLAELFLIPQNEKTQATSLVRLSLDAMKRFFPLPDDARVRGGLQPGSADDTSSYNSQFWYPRHGGIERLTRNWKVNWERVHVLEEVVEVDLAAHTVRTSTGRLCKWERLISTIPLSTFCARCTAPDVKALALKLTHSSTVCFNLGVRGVLPQSLRDVQWIYTPDRSLPFYRVGFYSNISPRVCPRDCFSMYVEVGLPGSEVDEVDIYGDLQPRVLNALRGLGWVEPRAVVTSAVTVLRYAYTHHTHELPAYKEALGQWFSSAGVFLAGRYGQWEYISMEDAICSGIATAAEAVR